MCSQAGIGGNTTNHSLRATGATQMYNKGAPEKLIQERTGHRSLEALRAYERTNSSQHQAVSNLSTTTSNHYMQEIVRVQANSVSTPMQQSAGPSQLPLPGFNFQTLHGCTININTTPSEQVM